MAWKFAFVILVLVIAVIVKKVQIWSESISLPPGYTFNDDTCSLVGVGKGLVGSEDLAIGRHAVVFVTSGDLFGIFEHGPESSASGGVWMLDPRPGAAKEPVKAEIVGFPAGKLLHPHGFDVSNATDRMFLVNHHSGASSIEVLKIRYHDSCAAELPWRCAPASLEYVTTVSSPHFPVMGINDVVEADEDTVYVTQWKVFGFPAGGQRNPSSYLDVVKMIADIPIAILSLKFTRVFHCSISSSVCEVATDQKFVGANGITISGDRGQVFVNDPTEKAITVLSVDQKNHKLSKDSVIQLPLNADNIEYDDATGEIVIGTIPCLMTAIRKSMDPDSVAGVPGGMAVASRRGSGWVVRDILEHDGLKLSQISAAARWGGTVILGSPGSEGVLVCTGVSH